MARHLNFTRSRVGSYRKDVALATTASLALGIEVATSIPSQRAIRVMDQLIELHGKPAALRLDNGSELTAHAFVDWAKDRQIDLRFIAPGKPNQNAFIERFNKTYRTEVLNAYVFESVEQVQEITDDWLTEYNEQRPHARGV